MNYQLAENKQDYKLNLKWLLGINLNTFKKSEALITQKNSDGLYEPIYYNKTSSSSFFINRALSFKENNSDSNTRKILKLSFLADIYQTTTTKVTIVDYKLKTNKNLINNPTIKLLIEPLTNTTYQSENDLKIKNAQIIFDEIQKIFK